MEDRIRRENRIRSESLGVGGDALQGLGAAQIYSEAPEVKHNYNNCTSKTTSLSSGSAQYTPPATLAHFLFIYMFYIYINCIKIEYKLHKKLTAYATFFHSEHCLWIHLVNSMHLTEFTTSCVQRTQSSQEVFS